MTTGFSISIKALDEASAQIARINKALKDLEKADQSADAATSESARKSKNRFDELNKGVSEFGKNARAELLSLAKHFSDVGGGIGRTIDTLGKAFNLGGLAVGFGFAAKGAEKIGGALLDTVHQAQDLRDLARSIVFDPSNTKEVDRMSESVQRVTTLLRRFYHIGEGETTNILKGLNDLQIKFNQGKLSGDQVKVLQQMMPGVDIGKTPTDQLFTKFIEAMMKPENGFLKSGNAFRQIIQTFFGGTDLEKIPERGKDYWDKHKAQTDAMTVQTGRATTAFERLNEILDDVLFNFDQFSNALKNFAGEHPELTAAAGGVGAILTGILGVKLTKGIMGWAGKALGLGAGAAAPAAGAAAAGGGGLWAGILGGVGALGGAAAAGIAGLFTPDSMLPKGMPEKRKGVVDSVRRWINRQITGAKPGEEKIPGENGVPSNGTPGKGSDAGAPSPIGGKTFDEKAPGIISRLMQDFNLAKDKAAALVGNFGAETGGFKNLQEISPLKPGSRGGWGWAQWTGPRRRAFEAWTAANKLDPRSDEANYGFLKHELSQSQWAGFLKRLRETGGDATMLTQREYEGPARLTDRSHWTRRALRAYERSQNIMPAKKEEPAEPAASSHQVDVTFNNLPAGSRVNVGDARGDANLNLRTRYSLGIV